jgi:hypothetical protein
MNIQTTMPVYQNSASSIGSPIETASVSVCNFAFAAARPALNRIDFAARLHGLHHDGKARAVAGFANVLFDLWLHL